MSTEIMNKSLSEISWNVTEEEYRRDPALSYSTLAKFKRSGFNELEHLFDRIETPSLTFGSAVDSIITGGAREFEDRFMVADFPSIPDSIVTIVKALFNKCSNEYTSIEEIPDAIVIAETVNYNYQSNWKPETRAKVIKEKGSQYYKLLYISQDKSIIDTATYKDVLSTVDSLKSSEATGWYFADNNPFDDIERYYQLKFKATLNGIEYRCMADLLVVDTKNKVIIPVDLKTSSKPEWDFYKSFVEWTYSYQSRLYWRIIRKCMDNDPFFKHFRLENYRFIVANRRTLTPLVWECEFTKYKGPLTIGNYMFEDPEDIGKELNTYMTQKPSVPIGINLKEINSLTKWLSK